MLTGDSGMSHLHGGGEGPPSPITCPCSASQRRYPVARSELRTSRASSGDSAGAGRWAVEHRVLSEPGLGNQRASSFAQRGRDSRRRHHRAGAVARRSCPACRLGQPRVGVRQTAGAGSILGSRAARRPYNKSIACPHSAINSTCGFPRAPARCCARRSCRRDRANRALLAAGKPCTFERHRFSGISSLDAESLGAGSGARAIAPAVSRLPSWSNARGRHSQRDSCCRPRANRCSGFHTGGSRG